MMDICIGMWSLLLYAHGKVHHSSLWERDVLAIDKSMEDGRPFEGLILVGSPLFRSIKLSCIRSSSMILPLWSVFCDPQVSL